MLVIGWDRAVARWVGDRLEIDDFGQYKAIGLAHKDALIAGVVFNNYRKLTQDIEITAYSETPLCWSPGFLAPVFRYPFNQLDCRRVTAVTAATNQPARAFLWRLGFREEGLLRRAFMRGEDAVIFGLLREECRWLERGRHAVSEAA